MHNFTISLAYVQFSLYLCIGFISRTHYFWCNMEMKRAHHATHNALPNESALVVLSASHYSSNGRIRDDEDLLKNQSVSQKTKILIRPDV